MNPFIQKWKKTINTRITTTVNPSPHTKKKFPLSQQKTKERIDGHKLQREADTRNKTKN